MSDMKKVRLQEDLKLFERQYYAGQVIEVSQEVYEQIQDKVELVEESDAEQV